MNENILLLPILIPLVAGIIVFILPKKYCGITALCITCINFIIAIALFNKNLVYALQWLGFGIDFILRTSHFNSFIILAAGFFSLLITLYSLGFFRECSKLFFAYLLISLSLVNGAVLADNLVVLLFFWEGLLLTLYGLISIGGSGSFKTAKKAFIIAGVSDLFMMAGIALTGFLSGTLEISKISLPLNSITSIAFIFLVIGAVSKAGAMPFHTWIPDAATDAPLPFMAFFPASIEKLLGIYFLGMITLNMFQLKPSSFLSIILMTLGVITIIFAVMIALVQKDYKKLLSYHAISQVGYMILGIGTCVPIGIVGGIFHMLNHALYKCCLFLTGGSVQRQAGTTDLEKLGGLRTGMPVTFICFIISAASISGMPPFNGFFSKELIYDAALERGVVFYTAAVLGSFFTAASFLKLGHAAFIGKTRADIREVKEAPISMLMPMIILAVICVAFGIFNFFPLNNFIQPAIGDKLEGHNSLGFHVNPMLFIFTLLSLSAAFIHHVLVVKIKGNSLEVSDGIHYAPVLSTVYKWQEKGYLDPYEIAKKAVGFAANLLWRIDRAVNWAYDVFIVRVSYVLSRSIRKTQSGYYVVYVIWSIFGALFVMLLVLS